MRIEKITLKDFRNHEHTELDLAPLTVIKGYNNSGKTSVRNAIEAALTGRAEFTDRGGRGLADAVRTGAKKALVSVSIDGLGEVTRTISPSGSSLQVADWSGTSTAQQNLLYQKLGADEDLLAALLNVSHFINLTSKEQKEMIFALARPEISAGALMSAVNDYAESQGAGNLLDELRTLIKIPETVGTDWIDQAYNLAFEARREAKKNRDSLAGKLEGLTEDIPSGLPAVELPELERQIAALEAEREKLREKVAAAEAAEERREALARREEKIKGDLEALRGKTPDEKEDPEELRAALEVLAAKLEAARKASYEAQSELKALDASLPKLKKWAGDCPLGPGVIACTMSDSDRKALVKDLEGRRKEQVKAHEKAMKETAELEAQRKELEGRLTAATSAENAAREREILEKQLEEIQAELAILPEAVGLDLVRQEISTLDERIRNGYDLAARIKAATESRQRAEKVREEAKEAADRAKRLQALVTLLGPAGIKEKLIAGAVATVAGRADENLGSITGGAHTLYASLDPDFHLLVNGLELGQISTSERLRVGIACAEALAHASGLGLLVIDDVEILDLQNRSRLTGWIYGRLEEYDTAIVISTSEEAQDPGVEGVATYWVEGGKVERVGRVEVTEDA